MRHAQMTEIIMTESHIVKYINFERKCFFLVLLDLTHKYFMHSKICFSDVIQQIVVLYNAFFKFNFLTQQDKLNFQKNTKLVDKLKRDEQPLCLDFQPK